MKTKQILASAALLALSISVLAQTPDQKRLNDCINSMSSLETPQALTQTPYTADQLPQVVVNNQGEAFQLKRIDKDIKDTPGTEMFASDATTIFPGAIVFADRDFADGRPTLVGLPEGYADIYVEFNTGSHTPEEQIKLNKKAVENYIFKIVNGGQAGFAPPVNFNAQTHYCSSTSEVMFAIGCDAKYMKDQVKIDTKTTNNETKVITVQNFTQKFYTVSVTPYPITELYKYFGNGVTEQMFRQRVGNKPIAIINSVTYGRRAYYFESYHTTDMTFTGSQSASVNVGAVQVKATGAESIARSSETKDVFMFMLGGSDKPSEDILNGKTVREAFGAEGRLAIGPANQGIPISYTARFLASGRSVQSKAIGKTTEVTYIKMPKMVNWEIKNNAPVAGECVKFKTMFNVAVVKWDAQKKQYVISKILKGSGSSGDDLYIDWNESKFSKKGEVKRRKSPSDDITKQGVRLEDCYIYGPIYYTIRSRTAEGQKWSQSDAGYFDVSSCEGTAKIVIEGSALAGSNRKPYVHSSSNPKPIH